MCNFDFEITYAYKEKENSNLYKFVNVVLIYNLPQTYLQNTSLFSNLTAASSRAFLTGTSVSSVSALLLSSSGSFPWTNKQFSSLFVSYYSIMLGR